MGGAMKYPTHYACSIPDQKTLIITGGVYTTQTVSRYDSLSITGGVNTTQTVSRYDTLGFLEDLPSLNEGRWAHGCGAYLRDDLIKEFVVAGGYDGEYVLSSTGVLSGTSSAWVQANPLPKKLTSGSSITLNGVVYITGGYEVRSDLKKEVYF